MVIGIDASRANLNQKTGTELYSYFLIQELKKIVTHGRALLYSREYLKGDLATLPKNFENRILKWPPILLWTQIRLSFETFVRPPDYTKQKLIKSYKTHPGKIHVIQHGAPEITYSQNLARKNYLLYIGMLEKKKNILGILRDFKIVAF